MPEVFHLQSISVGMTRGLIAGPIEKMPFHEQLAFFVGGSGGEIGHVSIESEVQHGAPQQILEEVLALCAGVEEVRWLDARLDAFILQHAEGHAEVVDGVELIETRGVDVIRGEAFAAAECLDEADEAGAIRELFGGISEVLGASPASPFPLHDPIDPVP